MSKIITIDLNSNPTVKDLIAEMEPGSKVVFYTALKAKDDQTAQFTIEEAEEGEDKEPDNDEDDSEESGEGTMPEADESDEPSGAMSM